MVEPVQAFALISVSPVFFCNSIFLVIGLAQCYTYEVYRLRIEPDHLHCEWKDKKGSDI